MLKPQIIDVPLFPAAKVILYYGVSPKKMLEHLLAGKHPQNAEVLEAFQTMDKKIEGLTFNFPGGLSVVWTRSKNRGVLVHELCHATISILHNFGVTPSVTGDETFCYAVQHLYDAATKRNK